jgi:hypothetical protein
VGGKEGGLVEGAVVDTMGTSGRVDSGSHIEAGRRWSELELQLGIYSTFI